MAIPTNTAASYAVIGNREDLGDIIHDVSPRETPVLTAISGNKATGTKHEWLKRSLTAASSSNFVIEGDDATTDAVTNSSRVYNYCCISDKVPRVSGTQNAVDRAGVSTTMAEQMEVKMAELKRDVESIILENNAAVAAAATVAAECAGLQAWLVTNQDIAGDATAATGDGTDAHTDGTARALTEAMFESVLASCWTNGGNPTMGVCNAFQKRKVAAFSGAATRDEDSASKKVTNSVDIYIDPLGSEIMMVPDRFAPTDVVYFIDPEYLKFSTLRDFQSHDLAKTGDSIRKQILVQYTLEVCTEAAHGIITDLAAS